MLYEPVCILAHLEKVSFFFGGFDFSAAVGALAVYELAFSPEALARGAVKPLVRVLVNIALFIEFFKRFLHGFNVIFVGGAYEFIV